MKIKWSTFYSLLLLVTMVSCGGEEFGTVPQSGTETPNALQQFSHNSCAQYTLIKPKVDVLYLVDNSLSQIQIPTSLKDGLKQTALSLSTSFDYRVIGTPLLETSDGNNDYQVMTNSSNLNGISSSKLITNPDSFNFFNKTPLPQQYEKGLNRTVSFINAHKNSLLRNGAHLIIVIISNGRDSEVEIASGGTTTAGPLYATRLAELRNFKSSQSLAQLRLFSVTAEQHLCKEGWWSANNSYVKMAEQIYYDSQSGDNSTYADSYNLCNNEHTQLFSGINSSIQQQVLKHQYRYWPVTFAESASNVSINELQVFKVSENGTMSQLSTPSEWVYEDRNTQTNVNTRELPTPGEPVLGRHFIRFTNGNLITYPDCVLVKSVSKTEYFGYIVLPQKPVAGSVAVWINGTSYSSSAWTDESQSVQTKNIKVDHPGGNPPGSANPPIVKTGFMLKLKPGYYYKSGDSVQFNYTPAPI